VVVGRYYIDIFCLSRKPAPSMDGGTWVFFLFFDLFFVCTEVVLPLLKSFQRQKFLRSVQVFTWCSSISTGRLKGPNFEAVFSAPGLAGRVWADSWDPFVRAGCLQGQKDFGSILFLASQMNMFIVRSAIYIWCIT